MTKEPIEELRADELTAEEAVKLVLKRPGMYGLTRTDEFRKVEAERDAARAALEAALAARQPTEGDRESLAQLIALGLDDTKNLGDWSQDYQDEMHQAADVILAAGFSRTAVPDAATEGRIERWRQLVGKGVEKRMAAEAERDAALAAIERVRAAVNGPHPANSGLDSFTLAHISAALDGAPEPEVKP